MQILFIAPMYYEELSPSIGVLNLATILNQNGYSAAIMDFQYMYQEEKLTIYEDSDKNFDAMANAILLENPCIVGFSSMYNCYHTFIKIAERIKLKSPDTKIIFGGPQASVTAYETLRKFEWIDIIAVGESEKYIVQVVEALLQQKDFISIPSIAYRQGNQILQNEASEMIQDLDVLPYPDFSLLPYSNQLESFPIEGGRGCPYGCIYCSSKTFWKRKYRMKSISRIIDEIRVIMVKYNVRQFSFIHDLFTANKHFIIEFCEKIIAENLDIEWCCSARIDTIDKEIIELMKKAGCTRVYFGIETGSPRMQKVINKNLQIDNVKEKFALLKEYSMKEYVFSFIYGFPQEHTDDLTNTLNMIEYLLDNGFRTIQLHRLSILPGTEIFEQYKSSLILKDFKNVLEDVDMDSCLDIIQENPLLFSYFYDHNNIENDNLYSLEGFIANIYIPLYDILSNTFRLIKEIYDNNLIMIYKTFQIHDELFFKETCSHQNFYLSSHNSLELPLIKKLDQIQKLFESISFNGYTSIILDVFRFERSLVEFANGLNDDQITQNYRYDVIRVKKKKLKIDQIELCSTRLVFSRTRKKIEIRKISA